MKVIFVVVKSSALHAIFSLHHVVRCYFAGNCSIGPLSQLVCEQEATNPKVTAGLRKASGIWIIFIQVHYPLENWTSSTVWNIIWKYYRKRLENPISIVLSNSIVWKCIPCYGIILETFWRYSGNKTYILWKMSSFSSDHYKQHTSYT